MRCHMPCHDKYAIQQQNKNLVKSCSHSVCHAFPCRERCRARCASKNCCKNREADCKLYLFNIHTTTRRVQLRAAVESTRNMNEDCYLYTYEWFQCAFRIWVPFLLRPSTVDSETLLVNWSSRRVAKCECEKMWQICWVMVNRSDRIFTVCAVQWTHWLCRTVNGGNVRCHLCTRFATNERTARCGLFAEINGH